MTDPTPAPAHVPAGWYPAPEGGSRRRWWDGNQWTSNYEQPYTQASGAAAAPLATAPAGTEPYTPWIWLIVVLPLVSIIALLFVDFGSLFRFDPYDSTSMLRSELALFTSPAYLLSVFGGLVSYGLSVLFAHFDVKELTRRQVPRPFAWPWAFLSPYVYTIGRSVVVNRRLGRGITPMWVSIALYAVSIIVSLVVVFSAMAGMFADIAEFSTYP